MWLSGTVVDRQEGYIKTRSPYCGWNTFSAIVRCDQNGKNYELYFKSKFQNGGKRHKSGTSGDIVFGKYIMAAWRSLKQGVRIEFEVSDANSYRQTYVSYADNYSGFGYSGQEFIHLHYKIIG